MSNERSVGCHVALGWLTRVSALLLCLGACLSMASADDRRAVVLPAKTDQHVPLEVADTVVDLVAEALRTDLQWQVTPPLIASEGVADSLHDCWTRACAMQFATTFYADLAVVVSLSTGVGGAYTLQLSFVVDEDTEYAASGSVRGNADDGAEVSRVIAEAVRKRKRGPGPWLFVQGKPVQASVELDGKPLGHVPFRAQIAPGEHFLRVQAPAHEPFTTSIQVEPGAGSEASVDVDLTPVEARRRRFRERRSAWDYGVGAALLAVGLPYFVAGVVNLAKDGDCQSHVQDGTGQRVCSERVSVDGLTWTKLGVGAGAMAGGALTMGLAPFGALIEKNHGGTTAWLTYGRRF